MLSELTKLLTETQAKFHRHRLNRIKFIKLVVVYYYEINQVTKLLVRTKINLISMLYHLSHLDRTLQTARLRVM